MGIISSYGKTEEKEGRTGGDEAERWSPKAGMSKPECLRKV